jgi:hypothetical protein
MINFHFPVEELRDWLKTSPVYCGDYMIRHRIDFYQVWKGGQVVKTTGIPRSSLMVLACGGQGCLSARHVNLLTACQAPEGAKVYGLGWRW